MIDLNSKQIPFENLTREGIIDCYQAYYAKALDEYDQLFDQNNVEREESTKFLRDKFVPFDNLYADIYFRALIGEDEENKLIPLNLNIKNKYPAQLSKRKIHVFSNPSDSELFTLIIFTQPKQKIINLELKVYHDYTQKFDTNSRRYKWTYTLIAGAHSVAHPLTSYFTSKKKYIETTDQLMKDLFSIRTEPLHKIRMISAQCSFPLIPSTIIFDYIQEYYPHTPIVYEDGSEYYPDTINPKHLDISALPLINYRYEKPLKVLEGIRAVSSHFVTDIFKMIMEYDLPESINESITIDVHSKTAKYGAL